MSKNLPGKKDAGADEPIHGMVVDEDQGRLKFHGYLLDTIQAAGQSPLEILQLIRDIPKDPSTEDDSHGGAIEAIFHAIAFLSDMDVDVKLGITKAKPARTLSWLMHDPDFGPFCSILQMLEKKRSLRNVQNVDEKKILLEEVQSLDPKNLVLPCPGQTFRRFDIHNEAAVRFGMENMQVFRTTHHWIRKGQGSLQIGDEVWVIPGVRVGFVLRPQKEIAGERMHTLIGQAYISDMDSDLSEHLANKELVNVTLI